MQIIGVSLCHTNEREVKNHAKEEVCYLEFYKNK